MKPNNLRLPNSGFRFSKRFKKVVFVACYASHTPPRVKCAAFDTPSTKKGSLEALPLKHFQLRSLKTICMFLLQSYPSSTKYSLTLNM